jgi:filamentous hemagglutinin family protein
MNNNYKLVYSEVLNTWVAVAEHVSARGKKSALRLVTAAALVAGGAAGTCASLAAPPRITPPAVNQLPTGAQVAAGTVSFSQTQTATAASMAVQQSSNKAIVNWQSFNVGANAKVNITQPTASSVLLNRVQSSDPSQIFGQINANGQVLLLNPNGVYFAPGSRVDVGSFTASTHSISDADFLNGKHQFNRNGATGSILNEGHISAGLGGYIALLAPEVRNLGVVVAQVGGTVALAAGESYELQFNNNKQLTNVLVGPATLQTLVDNGQAVQAPGGLIILSAQAASGLLGGVVKNSGAISATGLVNDGGTIRLSASHKIELAPSSSISADAAPNSAGNGGRIDIITDLANASGITQVDGTISAKGGEQGGDGGFVDTSAAMLAIGENTLVTTGAAKGNAGTWLLDPYDVTIVDSGTASGTAYGTGFEAGAASTILSSSINSSLAAGTNVTISTGTASGNGGSANYAANTSGNIFVNGNIDWTSGASLTLTANYNINVGTSSTTGSITVPTGGTLNLNPGGSGDIYDSSGQVSKGKVLMGMASTPTGGLNATGFNGHINVASGATININNNRFTVINSEADFRTMTVNSPTVRYVLGSNLAFTGTYTQAVVAPGNSNPFKGDFNGFGHEISGLSITNATASSNTGLFGNAYANWTNSNISNIGVAGNISTTILNTDSHTGGLIGRLDGDNSSSVFNAYSKTVIDAVNANERYVGGLIGYAANVNVKNVSAAGAVTAKSGVGGLIGGTREGTISYANASGAVTANSAAGGNNSVGGLIGYVNQTRISYTYATGAVNASNTASANSLGGLIGKLDGSGGGSLTYSYATGNVTNASSGATGGLVGDSSNWALSSNVYATGNVQASTTSGYVGGLMGSLTNVFGGTVSYAYASNTVTGPAFSSTGATGGIFGHLQNGPTPSAPSNGITLTSLYWDSSKNTITAGVGAIIKSGTNATYESGGNGSGVSSITTANLKTASNIAGFTFGSADFGYAGSVNGGLPVLCTVSLCTSFESSVVAATYNGAAGGLWSLSTNWLGGIAPVAGSTVSEAIINSGSTVNYDTAIVGSLGFDIKNAGTISFTGSSDVTLSGVISGAGSLTKAGNGTVTLSGANTYTGTTTISAGTLKVGNGAAFSSSSGAILVEMGGALDLNGNAIYRTNTLTLNGTGVGSGGALTNSSTTAGYTTSPIVLGSDTSIGSSTGSVNLAGVISGAGNLTKIGSANSTFSGANTYTGTTTVTGGGILSIGHAQGLGSTDGGTIVSSTGRLLMSNQGVGAEALTLNGGSLEVTSGTSSLSGPVTLGADSSVRVDSGAQLTLSGLVDGTGRLNKTSGGTLVLTGTNTYGGGTIISAGTLQLGAGGTTGSIQGNVTNNATLAFNRSDDLTYANVISGTGSVTKLAANSLTFTGDNTYSGGTSISAGTVKAGSATALGTSAISVSNGAALDLNGQTMTSTGVLTLRGTGVSGTGALLNSGSTAATYAGALALGANSSIMSGASITSTISLTNTDALVGGGFTLTLGGVSTAGGDSFLYSVIDTTTTSVIKSGNAIAWNLYGANTYSGGTSINGGTLRAGSSTALGSGAVTVASSGSLDLRGQTMTSLGTLSLNGTGVSNLGALRNSSPTAATATYAGPLVLTGNTKIFANSGLIQLTHTGTITGATFGLTLGGAGGGSIAAIIGTTTGSLTKQDGGTWILSGANTYTGGTTVSAGTLQVGAGGTTGSISGNVSNTGVLDFNRSNDFTYAGAISGTGSVSKSGTGTLTLSGTSNFSGTTTVNSGTLAISNASGLGGTGAITLNGGTLRLQSGTTSLSGQVTLGANSSVSVDSGAQLTLSGLVSGTGMLTKTSLGTLVLTGTNTYGGGTTINLGTLQLGAGGTTGSILGNVTNNGTLAFNRSDDLTYANVISGTGAVTKLAANTLTFTGENTYSGGTTISAGTLQVGAGGIIGAIAGNVTNNATLAFNRSDALNISGAISGTGAVTKLGTGTTTLSGINTYTGLTTVSTGTLAIGNAAGLGGTAAGTAVANGATLDLQGVAVNAEAITLQGGTLATTTGTSSLSGAVTLGADSTINVAGSASQLTLSGLVTGARALTKSGTGKLIMSNQNTFSGGLTIAAGTATEGTTYNGTSGPFGSGTVRVESGATLDLNNYNVYAPVTLAGGALVNNATSGGIGQGDVSQGVNLTADSIFGGVGYMNAFTAITSNGYGLVFLGTGTKNLSSTSNTLSTIATGSGVGVLNVVNNQALTIGQVTAGGSTYNGINSTGTVSVVTRTGDLTVSQNVVTTSTVSDYTTPALKLGAGSLTAAGTPTGGDVVLSGTPTINVGTGGVALIYSGYATTSAARTLNASFAPKLTYYSINADSTYVPTVQRSAYFTLFRESPATLYTLYLPNQRFTYGTPITSLNYCYSTSASSCVPVTATGVPSTTQVLAANGAVPDVGIYPLPIALPLPDVTGYFFVAGNAVNIYVDPKPVTIANTAQTTTYNGLSTYSNLANAMTYTVSGLVGYDAVRSLTQTPSGSGLVASQVANAGSFTVTPGSVALSAGKTSNYTFSYTAATATVNKADLKVTAKDDSKFIGEADVSGFAGVRYTGFVAGETASVLSGSATVARSNASVGAAGTYAGVLSAAGSSLSSNNYNLIYEAGNYTIVPADQLLIRLNDASTTYGTAPSYSLTSVQYKSSTGSSVVDLTSRAAINAGAFTLSDGAGGNTALTLGPVAASLSSAGQVAAGSYQVGASSVTNTSANYSNTVNIVGSLAVEQKTLTPVATSGLSKVYDGTTSMSSLGFTLTGVVGADAVTATGLGTYANANAGNAKSFTVSGIGLGGTDATNYKLASNTLSATNGVITAAPLMITANNDTKTYDASAYAATAGVAYSGFVNGETAADLGGTLAYGGTAIGAVNVGNYVITPSGQTSSNYAISFGDGALNISPADVRVSATNVALTGTVGKVYDGTNVATLSSSNYLITGWQGSDGANITQTTGTYDNANAGTNKLVSVTLTSSDFSATNGTLLSNYNLPTAVSGNVGVISPKTVTVTNAARSNVYDGTSYAALALGTTYSVSAMVGPDAVASITQTPTGLSGTASGAAQAGTFTVTPGTAVLSTGTDSNYNFSYVGSTHTVTPAPLAAALTGSTSKVYDGGTSAVLVAGNFALSGFVNVEGASVSQTTGTLDTANVGSSKTVTTNLSSSDFAANSGTQLSNYTLPTSASGNIGSVTPAPLTVSAANASKTYDGAAYTGGNGVAYAGFVNNETPGVLGGTLAYTGTSQGARNAGSYVITPAGLSSSNYAVSFADGSLSVAPTPLTVTAVTNTKSFDGNSEAQAVPVVSGLKGSDAVVNLREAYADANPGTGKTLSVQSGYQIVDGNNGNNYLVSLVPNQTGEIRALPVAVLAPTLAVAPTGNSAPPTLTVLASSSASSSSSGSSSAGSAGGGSSAGVSVSTINSPSQQVTGLVAVLVPSGTATAGSGLVIALPEQVMSPAASGAAVQVTLPNNQPLPDWIRYDAATQTLVTSAVPAGAFPLSVVVTVGGQSTVVQISESQSNL